MEWNDFVLAYANKGGDCLELPAIEFGKHVVHEEDILTYIEEYEKLFDVYLKDNPLQAEMIFKSIKLRHYPTISKSPETVARIQNIINHLMKSDVFNSIELEIYRVIVNHCPMELIDHMAKQLLLMYKESANTDTYIRILNALTFSAKYFSELGYYERGYLAIPLMFLEVEHVYNQFRWNKPEAIPLAKNLFNYLQSAKFIDQQYYSNFINAFTYHCHALNKTGIDLF